MMLELYLQRWAARGARTRLLDRCASTGIREDLLMAWRLKASGSGRAVERAVGRGVLERMSAPSDAPSLAHWQ